MIRIYILSTIICYSIEITFVRKLTITTIHGNDRYYCSYLLINTCQVLKLTMRARSIQIA